jgi:hypothetical protein
MKLIIKGIENQCLITKQEMRKAASFFLGQLLTPKELKDKSIIILFCDDMEDFGNSILSEYAELGNDCSDVFGINNKKFYIRLNTRLKNKKKMLLSLAHELTHVKQYIKKELIEKDGFDFWKGVKYKGDTLYYKAPWEIEAYGFEHCLNMLYGHNIDRGLI